MTKYILLPFAIIVLVAVARLSFFTVDAAEYVYVTVLGEHRDTFDGADRDKGAGLKIGWPWPIQQVQRFDRRLQQFDLPATEQLTHDPEGNTIDKLLLIEAYVCWKISDETSVDKFVKRIGSPTRARAILAPRIIGRLGADIGEMRMDDLVNTSVDPQTGKHKVDLTVEKLRKNLLDKLSEEVRAEYGIELIDIRLRRFNHPGSVRDSIFQRIKAERSKEATKYSAEGERLASNKIVEADLEVSEALAKARSEAEKIKAEADIEANKIRNEAQSQDREFYAYLKSMEVMQSIVGSEKTMLLISTHRPLFERLFQPPRPKADVVPDKQKKGDK